MSELRSIEDLPIILNSAVGAESNLSNLLMLSRYKHLESLKMAHPLDDSFWPNNRPQTNRNGVKTLTKTGPYQTPTAEFRIVICCSFGCVRLTDASVTSESLVERKGSHHFHPEPCAGHREVSGEASVGACAGRAIEPRNAVYRMCRDCPNDRRQHFTAALG